MHQNRMLVYVMLFFFVSNQTYKTYLLNFIFFCDDSKIVVFEHSFTYTKLWN
jgi:hypothetical protein